MEFLLRDDAPFSPEQWGSIDEAVVRTARQILIGRRFLHIYGPLGAGVQSIAVDEHEEITSGNADFFGEEDTAPIKTKGRKFLEIPMVYKDLSIAWRDVENSKQYGLPLDISNVAGAAALCARKEDDFIFNGSEALGCEGLLTASGIERLQKGNWQEGENPFLDVAKGIELLVNKGFVGSFALTVSPDLYMQMQRIQGNTGLLELDRVGKLLGGNLYQSPVLGKNKAVLVCAEAQNMDLVVGQDMITGYMGPEKLNHTLRVLETVLLRIKRKEAIVVFE